MTLATSAFLMLALLASSTMSQTSADTSAVLLSTARLVYDEGFFVNRVRTTSKIMVDSRRYSLDGRVPRLGVAPNASKHPAAVMSALDLQEIGELVSVERAERCSRFAPGDCMDKGVSIVVSFSTPEFMGDSAELVVVTRASLEITPADSAKMDVVMYRFARNSGTVMRVVLKRNARSWTVVSSRIIAQT